MTLFQPAENTSAFLKAGFLGFAGSGKTKTSTLLAIGLVNYMRERGIEYANRPVFGLDTETGFDWVKPDFQAAGIELHVAKTRAFVDLLTAVAEAEKSASILIVDSISHFWKELMDSYSRAKAKQLRSATYRLQFQDWGYIKGEWSKFTDAYINSAVHIILAGRAGYDYDYFEDDEGKKQLEKTGVKMKAEGEMGYEPSLLVLMERNQKMDGNSVAATWREGTVLKDRSTLLDGKTFHNPSFKDFLPHIERLNLGGKQLGVDTTRTSEHAVSVEKKDWHGTQKAIVLEEIEAVLVEHYPSTKVEDKTAKASLVLKHFQTRSWTEVTNMRLEDLKASYDSLHQELTGKPSRYGVAVAQANAPAAINDSLPDHSAPPVNPAADGTEKPLIEKLEAQLLTIENPIDVLSFMADTALDKLTPQERAGLAMKAKQHSKDLFEKQSEAARPKSRKRGGGNGNGGEKPEAAEAADEAAPAAQASANGEPTMLACPG
jgi:hypothetical protein